jgi:hypothetical protein
MVDVRARPRSGQATDALNAALIVIRICRDSRLYYIGAASRMVVSPASRLGEA